MSSIVFRNKPVGLDIPHFDEDEKDPARWIVNYEVASIMACWTESLRIDLLNLYNDSKAWPLSNECKTAQATRSWDRVRAAFIEFHTSKDPKSELERLAKQAQKVDEEVLDYVADRLHLYSLIGKAEGEVIPAIVHGIRNGIMDSVLTQTSSVPNTFAELRKQLLEKNKQASNRRRASRRSRSRSD